MKVLDPVALTFEFDPLFENFNLVNNLSTVSAGLFIFHANI